MGVGREAPPCQRVSVQVKRGNALETPIALGAPWAPRRWPHRPLSLLLLPASSYLIVTASSFNDSAFKIKVTESRKLPVAAVDRNQYPLPETDPEGANKYDKNKLSYHTPAGHPGVRKCSDTFRGAGGAERSTRRRGPVVKADSPSYWAAKFPRTLSFHRSHFPFTESSVKCASKIQVGPLQLSTQSLSGGNPRRGFHRPE